MIGVALLSLALCAAAFAIDRILPTPDLFYITSAFFHAHDAFWGVALALFLMGLAVSPLPAGPFQSVKSWSPGAHWTALFALALLVVMLGALGAHRVLLDYPLSWDESLARFDALIFRSGRIVAPLAEEWRRYADALAWQSFMQPVADHAALVSAYLPVNAGLRALIGGLTDERLTSPLLAALAILSAYGVGRRLWPDRRDAAFVAAVLVLTSCQVLVTAMTPYAMTAHLAFNLLWLWLFLRDARLSHAGAILIGFLASGLHQLVFHPLFAAPFVFSLYRQKRIGLALVYTLSYAGIGLFWISYWKIGLALQDLAAPGAGPGAGAIAGTGFFFERVASLLIDYEWHCIPLMAKNSLRFIVWQNPLLLPLAALSWRALAQDRGYARELLAGVILTFAVMCLLMPYQGHGWGYRYLHGLIGNLALLGGQYLAQCLELGLEQFPALGSKCLVLLGVGGVGLADLRPLLLGQAELVGHSPKPLRHGLAQLLEIRTETSLFLLGPDQADRTQEQGGEGQSAQQLLSHAHDTTLRENEGTRGDYRSPRSWSGEAR